MEKKTGNNKGNVIGKILRRPIVRIALLLVIIISISLFNLWCIFFKYSKFLEYNIFGLFRI